MTESAPEFENWNERVRHAQEMIPLIYQLHRKNNVVTSIFGRLLVGVTDIDIIKSHRYARRLINRDLGTAETLPILRELVDMNLGTASIDMGRLAEGFRAAETDDLRAYL